MTDDGRAEQSVAFLREANPADPGELRALTSQAELERLLLTYVERAEATEPHRSAWRVSKRRRFVLALAAAAAMATTAVLALAPGGPRDPGSVEDVLSAAAAVAQSQPYLLARGQSVSQSSTWWKRLVPGKSTDPRTTGNQVPGGHYSYQRRILIDPSGIGRVQIGHPRGSKACSRGDAAMVNILQGGPWWICHHVTERSGRLYGAPSRTPAEGISSVGSHADTLPSDPAALSLRLDQLTHYTFLHSYEHVDHPYHHGQAPHSSLLAAVRFNAVALLLSNPLVHPDVRATLFRLAARIPGVSINRHVTDPLGRRGAALSILDGAHSEEDFGSYKNTHVRRELIFNPATSAILATRESLLSTDNQNVRPWLDQVGAPQVVAYEAFGAPHVIDLSPGRTSFTFHEGHFSGAHIASRPVSASEVSHCEGRLHSRVAGIQCRAIEAMHAGKLRPGNYTGSQLKRALDRAGFPASGTP